MPLMPKRVKYRQSQRGSRKGNAMSGSTLAFGEYGLRALDRCWMTNIQIEACRVAMNREMKRKGKLWIRIFPDVPFDAGVVGVLDLDLDAKFACHVRRGVGDALHRADEQNGLHGSVFSIGQETAMIADLFHYCNFRCFICEIVGGRGVCKSVAYEWHVYC